MHKRLEAKLLPLNSKIERTLRNLKKVRVAEKAVTVEQEATNQHVPVEPIEERP